MKYSNFILILSFITIILTNCSIPSGIDDDLTFLDNIKTSNLNGVFNISNDNTGLVTIIPSADGYSYSEVIFGHGDPSPVKLTVGNSVNHNYPEGNYTVTINYYNLKGDKTTKTYPLTVTYRAPENMKVNLNLNGDVLNISATADFANGFQVLWGDGGANESPTAMTGSLGKTFTAGPHTYTPGKYTLTVTALSGGAAKVSKTFDIIVFAPFALPITYENPAQNYNIGGTFGGVNVEQLANPFPGGINTSANVRKYEKTNGAANWSGTWTPLSPPAGVPIDMNNGTKIKVMVYATETGKSLNVELEQASGGLANQVLKVPISKANEWVDLTFDFGALGVPASTTFKQLVFRYNDAQNGFGEIIYLDNIRQSN
ncbi:MAG: hypothetical protein ACM3PT_06170 [Deltaproteobacteria bacterium]